jgi:hypothetical protein
MMDIVFVGAIIALSLMSCGMVAACDRLRGRQ